MKNNLTYSHRGEYLIPDLTLSKQRSQALGKYGRMRKKYLQENRQGIYSRLLLSEKLQAHLLEVDQMARQRLDLILPALAKEAGATEELKAYDPMKWAGLMNNCKAQAEEIILSELVFN